MEDDEYWNSFEEWYFQCMEEFRASQARLGELYAECISAWGDAWEQVLRKVEELDGTERCQVDC